MIKIGLAEAAEQSTGAGQIRVEKLGDILVEKPSRWTGQGPASVPSKQIELYLYNPLKQHTRCEFKTDYDVCNLIMWQTTTPGWYRYQREIMRFEMIFCERR